MKPAYLQAWDPEGFLGYTSLYPLTSLPYGLPDLEPTEAFVRLWRAGPKELAERLCAKAQDTSVVFVRGYLGCLMPGNLEAPTAALRQIGFDSFVAAQRPWGTVAEDVAHLARQLERRPLRRRLVLCGHSRGGLEILHLLNLHPVLARRCAGVFLSQTPCGPSRVLESILLGRHRQGVGALRHLKEWGQRLALQSIGANRGGLELIEEHWTRLVEEVTWTDWEFPVFQTASWSSRPTAWLDSFHERLGEIAPGCAHDGQFYLQDLLWPGLPHVLLPHLDHAQPAMGGQGFDHCRYWQTLLAMEGAYESPG